VNSDKVGNLTVQVPLRNILCGTPLLNYSLDGSTGAGVHILFLC